MSVYIYTHRLRLNAKSRCERGERTERGLTDAEEFLRFGSRLQNKHTFAFFARPESGREGETLTRCSELQRSVFARPRRKFVYMCVCVVSVCVYKRLYSKL